MASIVGDEGQIVYKSDGGDLCIKWSDTHSATFQKTVNSSVFIGGSIVKGQTSETRKETFLRSSGLRGLLTSGSARIHFGYGNRTYCYF